MEEEQFDELHRALVDDIYRYAARRTSHDIAQDVVAEVFAALWVGRDRIPKAHDEQRAWVFGVARRQLARAQHSEGRHRNLLRRLVTSRDAAPIIQDDVALALVESDEARHVWKQLHPKDQEVLTLVAWERLTAAEVASVLDISISNVATRLHRARRRLVDLINSKAQRAAHEAE